MIKSIEVDNICIGPEYPCFIIAEIAQAHDGSLGMAHAYIDAVAKTGANAIKFQTHIAEEESSGFEPWRVKFSRQDKSRYDYWKRMEFSKEQWSGLKQHAREAGLIFISSPFSIAAIHLLDEIGMPLWKVASGEVNSEYLFDEMLKTRKPIIMSSGMSYMEELDYRTAYLDRSGVPWAIMECTTEYPTQPERVGLNQIPFYRERYCRPVGLSDHSGNIYASLAAVAMDADIIEVHVCFSKELFGPDVSASVTTSELKSLVEGTRFIRRIKQSESSKDARAKDLSEIRCIFGKGIMSRQNIKKGEAFTMENIKFVKPATGIGAEAWRDVLASFAAVDIPQDTFITREFMQEENR